jgi:hypothetical protein
LSLVAALTLSPFKSRTRRDLIIEVWERLDCESVGARELEEIAKAVAERFGLGALESPAAIARIVADEGAVLRHAEVLELDAQQRTFDPYDAMFRNILKFSDLKQAAASIRNLENLRRKFARERDQKGLSRVRETALKGKQRALMISRNPKVEQGKRAAKIEIAEWFTVWLQTPELFQDWLDLRQRSSDFRERFGQPRE